jgi:hypothetical protein
LRSIVATDGVAVPIVSAVVRHEAPLLPGRAFGHPVIDKVLSVRDRLCQAQLLAVAIVFAE